MTTNEMILATIKTKLTKVPKYKSVLEDMGYEVCDSNWSWYGNWSVRNPKTRRLVCISQNYGKKRRLFGGLKEIRCKDMSKVNMVGYLSKERESYTEDTPWFDKSNKARFAEARRKLRDAKSMKRWYEEDVEDIKKKIAVLEEKLEHQRKNAYEYELKIKEVREQFGLKH